MTSILLETFRVLEIPSDDLLTHWISRRLLETLAIRCLVKSTPLTFMIMSTVGLNTVPNWPSIPMMKTSMVFVILSHNFQNQRKNNYCLPKNWLDHLQFFGKSPILLEQDIFGRKHYHMVTFNFFFLKSLVAYFYDFLANFYGFFWGGNSEKVLKSLHKVFPVQNCTKAVNALLNETQSVGRLHVLQLFVYPTLISLLTLYLNFSLSCSLSFFIFFSVLSLFLFLSVCSSFSISAFCLPYCICFSL